MFERVIKILGFRFIRTQLAEIIGLTRSKRTSGGINPSQTY